MPCLRATWESSPAWTPIVPLPGGGDNHYLIEIDLMDEAETFRLRLGNVVADQVQIDLSQLRRAADHNQDSNIDLSEFLRAIETCRERNGTTRTGRYQAQTGTDDDFAPEPNA